MLIKVTGISSLTDARYCAGMGVQKLQIEFDGEGNAHLNLQELKAIQAWIEGVEWVGAYSGSDPEVLASIARETEIKEWTISSALYSKLTTQNLDLNWVVQSEETMEGPGIVGYETQKSVPNFPSGKQLWLFGISDIGTVLELHQKNPSAGFVFQSGVEERPGWMDLSHLQDILEKLEETN